MWGTSERWGLVRVAYTYLEFCRVSSLLTQKRNQALHHLGAASRIVKREIFHEIVDWLFALFQDGKSAEIACQLMAI